MANSKYSYVRQFESESRLLPSCWIVLRLDGKAFTKFSAAHELEKPNDARALALMDRCAQEVMQEYRDIRVAFGQSDEYSFVFRKDCALYGDAGRRESKLVSLVASLFSASYVRFWSEYLPDVILKQTPSFDGRAVCYPNDQVLRDYLAWRQVDTHINTQYNTCYWALVHSGKSPQEAQATLKGTQTNFKNELLFQHFQINYNDLPQRFRKGSVVFWSLQSVDRQSSADTAKAHIVVEHVDVIKDSFWQEHPHILS